MLKTNTSNMQPQIQMIKTPFQVRITDDSSFTIMQRSLFMLGIYWIDGDKTFQEVTNPFTDYAISVDYHDGSDRLSISWSSPDHFHDSHLPERLFTVRHSSRSPVGPDDTTGFFSEPINKDKLIKPIEEDKPDPVNRPNHYQSKVEAIDCIEAAVGDLSGEEGFLTGSVIEHMYQWHKKNGVEDLKKAQMYLNRLIVRETGDE